MKNAWRVPLLALWVSASLGASVFAAHRDERKAQELATEFNVSAAQLSDIHERQDLSWREIRTALEISANSGASIDEVVRLKKSGMSFEDIAARYNLNLKEIEENSRRRERERKEERERMKEGREGREDLRDVPAGRRDRRAERLSREFGVTQEEVFRLKDKGYSWTEVRHTLDISQRSGRPVSDIEQLRDAGMSFEDIAAKYNLRLRERRAPDRTGTTESQRLNEGTMREAPSSGGVEPATPNVEPGRTGTRGETVPGSTPQTDENVQREEQKTEQQQPRTY